MFVKVKYGYWCYYGMTLDKQGYVNTATEVVERQFTLTTRNLQTAAKMNGN
jgi:hypothetical protein